MKRFHYWIIIGLLLAAFAGKTVLADDEGATSSAPMAGCWIVLGI